MSVNEILAQWEADEARVRARFKAPDVVPKGQAFNRTGLEMFEAIFSGELPPPPIGDTLDFIPVHMENGFAKRCSQIVSDRCAYSQPCSVTVRT